MRRASGGSARSKCSRSARAHCMLHSPSTRPTTARRCACCSPRTPSPSKLPADMADGYLLFVWKTSGYELSEQDGVVPSVGTEVEANGMTLLVTKVGPSPLP